MASLKLFDEEYSTRPVGTFVDLFAGCGGASLGLIQAGWQGLFAIEKNAMAFETLHYNLVNGPRQGFYWPEWLPRQAHEIGTVIETYRKQLTALRGTVDLVVGGPPCQGFSFAGRRDRLDARNELFVRYIRMVTLIRPKFLLLENVAGIQVEHGKKVRQQQRQRGRPPKPYSDKILDGLRRIGYEVWPRVLRAAEFGVAQHRPRFIVVGVQRQLMDELREGNSEFNPFDHLLPAVQKLFLEERGLSTSRPVSAEMALSDLEVDHAGKRASRDTKGFEEIAYKGPITRYQRLLNANTPANDVNSLRLANHRAETARRFREIQETCRVGVVLSMKDRERLGLKKHHTVVLDRREPSHTLTTLPDDLLHYSEPRILTVRECARLQSFPDWFEFRGKYTTGGPSRKLETPRYTQVGNAVPPFLAECLGRLVHALMILTTHAEHDESVQGELAYARAI
ncbi:DNA cytosine methyltransferase [Longimicrobium sp.]|uniref:DNA cytosine methyltransferase n=1 Tax=Longimicrobium sp. TaxID=2029185 RepID=UPI002E2FA729|nr:DNA cytosine methyltransferase [Longimicrobium sp.]HEX6038281.1 DNA cytosine methyltransferase [Longimicrobium sp.]